MENLQQFQSLAAELPEAVRENALDLIERMGSVIEGIGDEPIAWRPPILRIMQGTTDRSSVPRGTSIGDLLLGEEKLDSPLTIIPLRMSKGRQYWDPNPDNKKMLCQSPDAKLGYIGTECRSCPHSEWVEGEGSDCNLVWTLLAMTSDLRHLFTINFAKTSYKVGTELESLMRKAGVAPYARQYQLSTETVKVYEVYKIAPADAAARRTPTEYLPLLKALSDQIGADRKAAVENFYKMVEVRRNTAGALAAPEQAKALTDQSGADSTLNVAEDVPGPETEGSASQDAAPAQKTRSEKAKGYQV